MDQVTLHGDLQGVRIDATLDRDAAELLCADGVFLEVVVEVVVEIIIDGVGTLANTVVQS